MMDLGNIVDQAVWRRILERDRSQDTTLMPNSIANNHCEPLRQSTVAILEWRG